MKETFEQGWSARPFKEQFPDLTDIEAQRLDEVNKAISTLGFKSRQSGTETKRSGVWNTYTPPKVREPSNDTHTHKHRGYRSHAS